MACETPSVVNGASERGRSRSSRTAISHSTPTRRNALGSRGDDHGHPDRGAPTCHALTFDPDHLMGVGQAASVRLSLGLSLRSSVRLSLRRCRKSSGTWTTVRPSLPALLVHRRRSTRRRADATLIPSLSARASYVIATVIAAPDGTAHTTARTTDAATDAVIQRLRLSERRGVHRVRTQ
jgi:hypothetical protein